ncbi:MAG: hypothetical protein ACI4VW_00490 [Acutalibacteraceae bacterium]
MTKTRLYLKNGVVIEFWHDLKTASGVLKRCKKYARNEDSEISKINYRIAGEKLK